MSLADQYFELVKCLMFRSKLCLPAVSLTIGVFTTVIIILSKLSDTKLFHEELNIKNNC